MTSCRAQGGSERMSSPRTREPGNIWSTEQRLLVPSALRPAPGRTPALPGSLSERWRPLWARRCQGGTDACREACAQLRGTEPEERAAELRGGDSSLKLDSQQLGNQEDQVPGPTGGQAWRPRGG